MCVFVCKRETEKERDREILKMNLMHTRQALYQQGYITNSELALILCPGLVS